MRGPRGDFEIHITVPVRDPDRLAAFAAEHGLRFVHILLDRGVHVSQPMITVTGHGSPSRQQAVLRRWRGALGAAGFHPSRSKIEVAPTSAGVPADSPPFPGPARRSGALSDPGVAAQQVP